MKDYPNTEPTQEEAQRGILAPITEALSNAGLTIDRLCKDIRDVIKATGDNPQAKLKGVDMALKLQGAYPAERKHITTEVTLEDKLRELRESDEK